MNRESDEKTNFRLQQTRNIDSDLILFDMDGVLVDVSSSYRRAIQETVEFFSKKKVIPEEIQELKEKGGYNNDWDLAEALLRNRGIKTSKQVIINKFQELYWGKKGTDGFVNNETLLISKATLNQLHECNVLGIVTGRPRREACFILRKFNIEQFFDVIVTMEDYPSEKSKPHPYPIKIALERAGRNNGIYVGDSIDDIVAAKRAGIRPVGCVPPGIYSANLIRLLIQNGAEKVLSKVDDIKNILPLP